MLRYAMKVSAVLLMMNAPALAVSGADSGLESEPGFRNASRLIKAQDYAAAIPLLQDLDKAIPNNAEILNLLGFTHRKLKDYPAAKRFYDASLAVDPGYRPALEYQGMWFIETGNIPAAQANLVRLKQLCDSCEETRDLEEALAAVKP